MSSSWKKDEQDYDAWGVVQFREGEEHLDALVGVEAVLLEQPTVTDTRVPGRLRGRHLEYQAIGAEPYIVRTIKDGYKLEFDVEPPHSYVKNNMSARERPDFVRQELLRLEGLGCIKRVQSRPKIVNPMSVVFSNKWRLVLDGSRGLNPYCTKRAVRLDDHGHIGRTVQQGDFMVCNDLDSGYWHVPISEDHWQYLGVHHEDEEGNIVFYVWVVLVLGLRDAAHIFTRIIAPLMAELRREGARSLIYIDDNLTVARTLEKCLQWERRTVELFSKCGWVFKPSKRSGEPAQTCKYLGLIIDSRDLTFNIPSDKILTIKARVKEVKARKRVKVKIIARLIGTLQAARLATGPIVAVMTRSLYVAVAKAASWKSWVELDYLAKYELDWWEKNIDCVSKFPISGSRSTLPVSFQIASDASGVGHYAYLMSADNTILSARPFSEEERRQSSTWRELSAFHAVWTNPAWLAKFAGKRVCHYTDSQAMASIVVKGSRNPTLQPLVMEAALALRSAGIVVDAVWRSREEGMIKMADRGSRDFHADDVSLDFDAMCLILEVYGEFDVDTFASASNSKGRLFFSKLDVPGSAGMDFFHQTLDRSLSYFCFPPPYLLVDALQHFRLYGASAVMVVPIWANSSFYSTFWPDGRHAAGFVTSWFQLQPYFVCGPLVSGSGMRGKKGYFTACMKVDFSGGWSWDSRLSEQLCLKGGCGECRS